MVDTILKLEMFVIYLLVLVSPTKLVLLTVEPQNIDHNQGQSGPDSEAGVILKQYGVALVCVAWRVTHY